MPSCQLCGKDSDSLTKVKIEGATMKVCDSCSDMGEEVTTTSKKPKKKKKKSRSSSQKDSQVLVSDYGSKVKEAREDREISLKELAEDLKEKNSVVKKIEQEKLKPDKTLAGKISRELDIELYTNPKAWDEDTDSGDTRKATLGDVADIKE